MATASAAHGAFNYRREAAWQSRSDEGFATRMTGNPPKGRNETGMWWRRHDEYEKR